MKKIIFPLLLALGIFSIKTSSAVTVNINVMTGQCYMQFNVHENCGSGYVSAHGVQLSPGLGISYTFPTDLSFGKFWIATGTGTSVLFDVGTPGNCMGFPSAMVGTSPHLCNSMSTHSVSWFQPFAGGPIFVNIF